MLCYKYSQDEKRGDRMCADEYKKKIIEYWEQAGEQFFIDENSMHELYSCINITIEENAEIHNYITSIGKNPKDLFSIKKENLTLNVKKVMKMAFRLFEASHNWDTVLGCIQAFLGGAAILAKASIEKLPPDSALVLGALNREIGFRGTCNEEEAYKIVKEFCQAYNLDVISLKEFHNCINGLLDIKTITMKDGIITLKERISKSI